MPTHDVNSRRVLWAGAAIAAAVALSVAAVFQLLRDWEMPPGADRVRLPADLPAAGPGLPSAPQGELAQYLSEKNRLLSSGAAPESQGGTARVPIGEAMDTLARRTASAASAAKVPP